jgi:4-amino-4-deoxy-L-arabinose transferase-like glycosyltransferase
MMSIAYTLDASGPLTLRLARMWAALRSRLPLMAIVLLQGVVSLLTLQNTAFQDEALYLFAGRQIFNFWLGGPPPSDPYATYFSGYPELYPAFAGMLDTWGGLEAARAFSLLCMLGVTVCVYVITRRLFGERSALFAAAIYACQAPVLFIGRLATYDAPCLFFLALATTLAICLDRAAPLKMVAGTLCMAGLLVLATGMKYAGLLFVPAIILLAVLQSWYAPINRRRALGYSVLACVATLAAFGLAYTLMDKTALAGLGFTTTNRTAFIATPASELAMEVVELGGIALALGFIGFILARGQRFWLMLALAGTALLAPAYHIYKGEAVSLNKHIAFAVFFIVPLAGLAVTRFIDAPRLKAANLRWPVALALCLVIFTIGLQQAQNQYAIWANSSQMIAVLRTQVRPVTGHYLAEEYDVARYYLRDVTDPWQWTSLDWFTYTDHAGHQLSGIPAYQAAISEGYFDVVELNYAYHVGLDYAIDVGLKNGKHYRLIAKIPYVNAYGPGYYWIWVKISPPSGKG